MLLIAAPSRSQTCNNNALFKKGAELEYHTFVPRQVGFSKKMKFFEGTRLVFTVNNVVDSSGATYSFITKKGISSERAKNNYEKNYVISCREGKVYIPVDFYQSDTVYLSDIVPGLKKNTIYAATNLKNPATQYFSVDPAKNEFNFANKRYESLVKLQYFGMGEYYGMSNITPGKPGASSHYESSNSLTKHEMETATTIKKTSIKGKEKIEVAEQQYDCIAAEIETENEILTHKKTKGPEPNMQGTSTTQTIIVYYNESIGIIKTKSEKNNTAYFELYKVSLL
jgi:hypothetical protein